ncbi:MAG: hypothetical protein ACK58L_01545, partial [Planctomycetota bacterium]
MTISRWTLSQQISSLEELIARARGCRSQLIRIDDRLREIDDASQQAVRSLDARRDTDLRIQLDQLARGVHDRLEQLEQDIALQREAAIDRRERRVNELNQQFRDDVNACRSRLQSELWVLQSVCDEDNDDTPIFNAHRSREIYETQEKFLDEQMSEIQSQIDQAERYLKICHARMDATLPRPEIELKGRDASRQTAIEQNDQALLESAKLSGRSLPQWIIGGRLYVLAFLVFFGVTISATMARADLRLFLNSQIGKPDWEWFGLSCLIGFCA